VFGKQSGQSGLHVDPTLPALQHHVCVEFAIITSPTIRSDYWLNTAFEKNSSQHEDETPAHHKPSLRALPVPPTSRPTRPLPLCVSTLFLSKLPLTQPHARWLPLPPHQRRRLKTMGVHPVRSPSSPTHTHLIASNKSQSPTTGFYPNYDYSGPDSVCGINGMKPLFPVKTLTVEAGSTVEFGVSRQSNFQSEELVTEAVSWLLTLVLRTLNLLSSIRITPFFTAGPQQHTCPKRPQAWT